ncbi:hypothetical protein BMS3Bbin15_01198 [archaeon BMS3Bbin15]|nr:hypothetical protein BMS3Bbin15_01198 [archaeon BMS3Bbin15]
MQKLLVEFKNTPENTPQVLCSVSEVLNREETLSVSRTVLANNNSAQDQHSGKSGTGVKRPCHKYAWKTSDAHNTRKGKDFTQTRKSHSGSASTIYYTVVLLKWEIYTRYKAWHRCRVFNHRVQCNNR